MFKILQFLIEYLEFRHWVSSFIIWFWVFGLLEVRSILDLYFDKKWTFFTKILKFKIRTSIIRTSWNRKRHKNGSAEIFRDQKSAKCWQKLQNWWISPKFRFYLIVWESFDVKIFLTNLVTPITRKDKILDVNSK